MEFSIVNYSSVHPQHKAAPGKSQFLLPAISLASGLTYIMPSMYIIQYWLAEIYSPCWLLIKKQIMNNLQHSVLLDQSQ